MKSYLKSLYRRIGKLSEKFSEDFLGSPSDQARSTLVLSKILRSSWKDLSLFKNCITTWLMYWNVPALDVRSVGKCRLRGRGFHVQFRSKELCPWGQHFEAAFAVLRKTTTLCRNCADYSLVRRKAAKRKIKETEDGRFWVYSQRGRKSLKRNVV